jgi:hypothetical protein
MTLHAMNAALKLPKKKATGQSPWQVIHLYHFCSSGCNPFFPIARHSAFSGSLRKSIPVMAG